jgi:hypothetical protein
MSELRFRRLDEHRIGGTDQQMQLSYPVPRSPSGKVYRYSPNTQAAPRLFLLGDVPDGRVILNGLRARMRLEPSSKQTVCPYSGKIFPDEEYIHFDDVEAVKQQILWDAKADFQDMLRNVAIDFNRRQRPSGFISMRMEAKGSRDPKPLAIRTDLLRDLQCDICQRPYAIYAIALFCPDCGSPNVSLHFRREAEIVGEEIELADRLNGEGRAEFAYRLMGNAHEDVLTAFEATLKTLYRHIVRERLPEQVDALCRKKVIGNAFQNIERTRDKFRALDIDPFSGLGEKELALLGLNIQKRHVIGHNLGISDEYYAELTQSEQPGGTVRLLGDEIKRFTEVCLRVIVNLEQHLLPAGVVAQ